MPGLSHRSLLVLSVLALSCIEACNGGPTSDFPIPGAGGPFPGSNDGESGNGGGTGGGSGGTGGTSGGTGGTSGGADAGIPNIDAGVDDDGPFDASLPDDDASALANDAAP